MLDENVERVLGAIQSGDLVLDVGGWACPFNRADWVLDAEPYSSRGFYGTIGLPKSQGGDEERFSESTWVQRDICSKEPWPFSDKTFDFSICSHTLEDVRDPLFVCSELIRVSKGGYIEVPSRLIESCRGLEQRRIAGLSHHRWLIDVGGTHLQFTMKYHVIHSHFSLSLPPTFGRRLTPCQKVSSLFWNDSFTYAETTLHGAAAIYDHLAAYVAAHYRYPRSRILTDSVLALLRRAVAGARRRLPVRSGRRQR